MLKMYHRHAESAASAAYWEEFGSEGTLADRLRFCEVDPLRPLFTRFLKPGARMLEGGCGRGQYVAYYTARGANVVGLDFARDWLTAIHAEAPALKLCAGDVGTLPFKDGIFDLYYSGGVVEHFEGGADRALAEARRVLKPDGILLISVPYFSPLRHALAFFRRSEWRRVDSPAVDDHEEGGRRFYQYAYTVRGFQRLLRDAGFTVLGTQGYALVWGLQDVALIGRLVGSWERRRHAGSSRARQEPASAVVGGNGRVSNASVLKRLAVAEDVNVPAAGWLVRAGRWTCANMMMYVCAHDEAAAGQPVAFGAGPVMSTDGAVESTSSEKSG